MMGGLIISHRVPAGGSLVDDFVFDPGLKPVIGGGKENSLYDGSSWGNGKIG